MLLDQWSKVHEIIRHPNTGCKDIWHRDGIKQQMIDRCTLKHDSLPPSTFGMVNQ